MEQCGDFQVRWVFFFPSTRPSHVTTTRAFRLVKREHDVTFKKNVPTSSQLPFSIVTLMGNYQCVDAPRRELWQILFRDSHCQLLGNSRVRHQASSRAICEGKTWNYFIFFSEDWSCLLPSHFIHCAVCLATEPWWRLPKRVLRKVKTRSSSSCLHLLLRLLFPSFVSVTCFRQQFLVCIISPMIYIDLLLFYSRCYMILATYTVVQ
jgi:hypothetical protein